MDEEKQLKNNDFKILILLVFCLAVIAAAVWFFGWRVRQWEVIKQEQKIIYTNVTR